MHLQGRSYIHLKHIYQTKQCVITCFLLFVFSSTGARKIVYIYCGSNVVWACDHEGSMHFRIGVSMPQTESLPPAWVPVEGKPSGFGHMFTQVAVGGPRDSSVWALDNKRNVYVRKGICENMPIGTEWDQVEGKHRKHANKALYASPNFLMPLNIKYEVYFLKGIFSDFLRPVKVLQHFYFSKQTMPESPLHSR